MNRGLTLIRSLWINYSPCFTTWVTLKSLPRSGSSRSRVVLLNKKGFFTILFKGLADRSADSDGASRLFMPILYGLYNGINLDYGSVLWQQLIQSLGSTSRHTKISYARFWMLVTKWEMDKYHVPTMATSPLSSIGVFHTSKIITTHPSKFIFVGSIPESM